MFISFIKYLIDPFSILWIMLLVTFGTFLLKKERLFKWLAAASGVWFLLIAIPLVPNIVVTSLESRYQPIFASHITDKNAEYHIIILGAGHGFNSALPANSLLSHMALSRLNEGIRLHRQLPNSKLVLSGFSTVGNITGAEMLNKTAILLGVDEQSIILQEEPVNTYQEADFYAKNFGNTFPVILVTSAMHMPRAMMTFKSKGINPIASPTDFRLKGSSREKWFGWPNMSNIEKLRAGIYEYAGILHYRMFKI